ncbi:MAG: hypothetical protein Q8N48_01420 [Thiobacillus sp.]|nr:hypothetical protein [Thiobacillus sp.]MDP2977470.1 hypothetical protein [Thiobacillus sp.]
MKFFKLFVGAVLLTALSGGALAELKLIKSERLSSDDAGSYIKLVSEDGRPYWVTLKAIRPDLETRSYFLQLENFFDGSSLQSVALDKQRAPAHMSPVPQQGLLAVGTHMAEWSVIKLNKALTKVEKYGDLKSMLFVGATVKIGDKYIVGGLIKDNPIRVDKDNNPIVVSKPILIKMSNDLKIEIERRVQSMKEGRPGSIFVAADKTYVTMGFMDGSEIWEISPDLAPLKKIKLPGTGATGIPLRDGGFAVVYTSLPDLGVFVERFNASAQSLWKKKIYTVAMTGAGAADVLCELPDGLCLVAGNNDRLLVARIDANGQRVRITEDTRSGLSVPSNPAGYLVGVRDNKIHVRGRARNPDAGATVTSFHFVEIAAP